MAEPAPDRRGIAERLDLGAGEAPTPLVVDPPAPLPAETGVDRAPLLLLYLNVLVVASCGLVYELLAGALASYVLGDSVTQFSLVIGLYLFAMGIGAWLSAFLKKGLARAFLEVEIAVALVGGFSAPLLFFGFAQVAWFQALLYGVVTAIGVLVGLELPLLMRILKDQLAFGDLVSRVLTFDYVGALAASVLFPIVCVPQLGLIRTSLVFGLLNGAVALWGTWLLRPLLPRGVAGLRLRAILVLALLLTGLALADRMTLLLEEQVFGGRILHAENTAFQRIVLVRRGRDAALFLNGHLQFHTRDEHRYHEALVHPAMATSRNPRRVLVLGGGDGLAVREILRWPEVERVTLVEIDPRMTALARTNVEFAARNRRALDDPRVEFVHRDAFLWIAEPGEPYDVAIVDFPDPSSFSLGKLYTRTFYRRLLERLTPRGAAAIQCTSPLTAPESYWCVIRTLESAGFAVRPYHAAVPSFGVWGFALAEPREASETPAPFRELPAGLRYLEEGTLAAMFVLPRDLAPRPAEINRLDNQRLVRTYLQEWSSLE